MYTINAIAPFFTLNLMQDTTMVLFKAFTQLILVFSITLIFSGYAIAHPPFLVETHSVALQDGTQATLSLWVGDGIIGPDPMRAVIVKNKTIIAYSPLSTDIRISCEEVLTPYKKCIAYDRINNGFYVPSLDTMSASIKIDENNAPENYPEYIEKYANGFTAQPASIIQTLTFEFWNVFEKPLGSIVLFVWYCLPWLIFRNVLGAFRNSILVAQKNWVSVIYYIAMISLFIIWVGLTFVITILDTPISYTGTAMNIAIGVILYMTSKSIFQRFGVGKNT